MPVTGGNLGRGGWVGERRGERREERREEKRGTDSGNASFVSLSKMLNPKIAPEDSVLIYSQF